MFILDTDHLTVIQRQSEPAYSALHAKLQQASAGDIHTTIINVEEQMRGWLAVISRANRIRQDVFAYRQLHVLFSFLGEIPVLSHQSPSPAR